MSENDNMTQRISSRDLLVRFNGLIEALPADEAVATIAHYVLGVRYRRIADYLALSPRKAQRLAAAGIRAIKDNIRKQNLRNEVPVALWDFAAEDVSGCVYVKWLASEFGTELFWAPYRIWVTELISGVENRPCLTCGASVYGNDPQKEEKLASLSAQIGRPRKYCSNSCRQRYHYWMHYLEKF